MERNPSPDNGAPAGALSEGRDPEREGTQTPLPGAISVSELNRTVKMLVRSESRLQSVWVQGEFSQVRPPVGGNLYTTLKDADSQVNCTIWADKLRRLTVQPETGLKVLAHGYVDVYDKRGEYRLVVDEIRRFGVGDLHAQLEALKGKLRDEGLFVRKRALPGFPVTVGLVTSDTGAAVRDMVRIISRRFPPVRILLAPVLVQGSGAAEDIAGGIARLNRLTEPRPDVLIVGRGGGSAEDLAAFNEERVARAIFSSAIPVISAVGHETDTTIADLVADLRAATPSEAAERVVPEREDLLRTLDHAAGVMAGEMEDLIRDLQRDLDDELFNLKDRVDASLENAESRLGNAKDLLSSLDPRRVLARGYAVVTREGRNVESVTGLPPGALVEFTVIDGTAEAEVLHVTRTGEEGA